MDAHKHQGIHRSAAVCCACRRSFLLEDHLWHRCSNGDAERNEPTERALAAQLEPVEQHHTKTTTAQRRTTSNVYNAGNNGAVTAVAVTMGMMMLMK
jgi:hypothetical protein